MPAGERATEVCSPVDVTPSLGYKPGWTFKLAVRADGDWLCIRAVTVDSNNRTNTRATGHMFKLPEEPMTLRQFARWAFDRCLLCELHEAGEFFSVDGFRPFFPNHQDEGSPYELVERWESP